MKKVLIRLKVADLEAAVQFYCEELALFEVHQDYGMLERSLLLQDPSGNRFIIFEAN
jgi:hypothetical protein